MWAGRGDAIVVAHLVIEAVSINACSTRAIAIEEVASLDHETLYYAVENRGLIANRLL